MGHTLFTATGCARCKIAKGYLRSRGISYEECDVKAEGKDAFARFYREHRAAIYRDQSGVEFPVYTDGTVIRQGVAAVVGYFEAGTALDGHIGHSTLHGEWINGFMVLPSDSRQADAFIAVLSLLRQGSLKIELATTGVDANLLERIVEMNLAQRLIMEVKGPAALYPRLDGEAIDPDTLRRSMRIATRFPEFFFFTIVAPVQRADGSFSHLTPEEIGQTAQWIAAATGDKKLPYLLKHWRKTAGPEDQGKDVEPLPVAELFKHRTAARRHLVTAEIEKQS